jgi:hypothetical protein
MEAGSVSLVLDIYLVVLSSISAPWQLCKGYARPPTEVLGSNFPLTITESKKYSRSTLPSSLYSLGFPTLPSRFLFSALG